MVQHRLASWVASLRALPWVFRLGLRVALTSLFALGPAAPICYWLTVGFVTEAWPWLLWGETYLNLAENMRVAGRPAVFAMLLVLFWWLLGFVLEPRDRSTPIWLRALLFPPRALWVALVAFCLLATTPLITVAGVRAVRNWPPRTDHLLQENCGHCHSPYRPQHYIKSSDAWAKTVRRMIDRNGAPVSEEDAAKIVKWLQDYRGFSDSWMFRAKCLRCHGEAHLKETPRTAEEWAYVVDRLKWLSPFAYRVDQREQLKQHLSAELSVAPPPEGSPARQALDRRLELQAACNPCHSISLILEDGVMDNARDMVQRMSEKSPTFVPPEKVDEYTEWLKELPTDPEAFWELFPHDILLELD